MRAVVLLLLVANLVLWAGWRLGGGEGNGEPDRVAQQIAADRIRIVARNEPPPATRPAGETRLRCIAWGGLGEATADKLSPLITRRAPEVMLARETEQAIINGYRVQLDKLGARAAAERKARDLRELGVADYLVTGGNGAWLISLGVFSSEAAANTHLAAMRKRGVRSASIERVDYKETRVRISVSGDAASVDAAAAEVARELPDLRSELCVAPEATPAAPAEGTTTAPEDSGSAR